MNEYISKAQREVWEWKNELHNEIKDMELERGIEYLLKKAELVSDKFEKEGLLKKQNIHEFRLHKGG